MKTKTKISILELCIIAFVVIVIMACVMLLSIIPQQNEINYLQDTIKNKTNVSADYRQGWNDCINELQQYRKLADNATRAN